MDERDKLPTREEALEAGLGFYGEVAEVYLQDEEGQITDILLGTKVAIIPVETHEAMEWELTERRYFHFQRFYERAVRRDVRKAAKHIVNLNRAINPISS